MRAARAVLLGVALAMASVASASAGKTDVAFFEDSGRDVFHDACGPGIDLVGDFRSKGSIVIAFDDGVPIREMIHLDFFGTLTRTDSGNSISDPSHTTFIFDLVDGTLTVNGLTIRRVYPGLGLFAHDVGTVVFDEATGEILRIGGPHNVLINGSSVPAICEALA